MAQELGIDLREVRITRNGLRPVETRTLPLGHGKGRMLRPGGGFKHSRNPHPQKIGNGSHERISEGNGSR